MVNATETTRAPRGAKVLAQAFFSAAGEIPEDRRAAVVKAALGLIREQIKKVREKAKLARELQKAKGAQAPEANKRMGGPMTFTKAPKRAAPPPKIVSTGQRLMTKPAA
jgi:hypothetical protein